MTRSAPAAKRRREGRRRADSRIGQRIACAVLAVCGAILVGCDCANPTPASAAGPDPMLAYIVSCALSAGTTVDVPHGDMSATYRGELGIAPGWRGGGMSLEDQRRVSACVLARVNRFGEPVRIGISPMREWLATSPGATPSRGLGPHTNVEGGFFGNLFVDPPRRYVCGDTDTPHVSWLESLRRECTLPASAATALSRCGFVHVGPCTAAAFQRSEGDYTDSAMLVTLPDAP